jgi:hypothetical protein
MERTESAATEISEHARILGLTHPKTLLIAASNLWKRRGSLSATVKGSNWAERLFVLTEAGLFWFDKGTEGADGLGAQHGCVHLRHIQSIRPIEYSGLPSTSVEELQANGPKYLLEISYVISESPVLLGGTDSGMVSAWHETLSRTIQGGSDTPGRTPGNTPGPSLLRLELTGIVALGTLGKSREALTGMAKETLEKAGVIRHTEKRPKQGWTTRVVVLTEQSLWFYKPLKGSEEESGLWGGFGFRGTGTYIFGREVGWMPLSSADVAVEKSADDGCQLCARNSPRAPPPLQPPPAPVLWWHGGACGL